MTDDVQIEIIVPEKIDGNSLYNLTVKIQNTSSSVLEAVNVEPVFVGGELLDTDSNAEIDKETEAEKQCRLLFDEMERQAKFAHLLEHSRSMGWFQRFLCGIPSPKKNIRRPQFWECN